MDIPLKPSVSNHYGLANQYGLIFGNEPNLSNPDKFDLLGYVLNRDFEIQVTTKTWKRQLLVEGSNDFEGDKYDVMQLKTWFHGICYKIQPLNQLFKVPFQFKFAFKLNESLAENDKPKALLIYLTSNDSWQGISTSFWPQYNPTMIKSNLEDKFKVIYLKATENIFLGGVKSTEDCYHENLAKTTCPLKCIQTTLKNISMCPSSKDWECVFKQIDIDVWAKCHIKTRAMTYSAVVNTIGAYEKFNEFGPTVYVEMWSMLKQIKEEIEVISFASLIGSVGGSLGMFFGFSIASYILYLVDRFIDQFLK